jgi:hypothetical protein
MSDGNVWPKHEQNQPIHIPIVPDDASLIISKELVDLKEASRLNDQALLKNQEALLANHEFQIKQLTEIIEIQKNMIALLEKEVQVLGNGGCCGSDER